MRRRPRRERESIVGGVCAYRVFHFYVVFLQDRCVVVGRGRLQIVVIHRGGLGRIGLRRPGHRHEGHSSSGKAVNLIRQIPVGDSRRGNRRDTHHAVWHYDVGRGRRQQLTDPANIRIDVVYRLFVLLSGGAQRKRQNGEGSNRDVW